MNIGFIFLLVDESSMHQASEAVHPLNVLSVWFGYYCNATGGKLQERSKVYEEKDLKCQYDGILCFRSTISLVIN